jgi:hypothetical protein
MHVLDQVNGKVVITNGMWMIVYQVSPDSLFINGAGITLPGVMLGVGCGGISESRFLSTS